ncbi:MAG TPA: M14 family metallopeptidase [Gemmatimonadales bacterium]|nr:M14 family metallopeptidase [Gemmatimonadales bacterium]
MLNVLILAAVLQQADPHSVMTVGTATAKRGEKAYGEIVVPAGVDSGTRIAVAVIHGAKPGPVLAIVSGAHGTEYASIVAVSRLIDRINPASLSGTVILVPLVNVASFEQKVPHVNPVDRKSMNRFYPGNPAGTQTERASDLITRQVVEQSDHLIDLHGGDLDENLRPYSYWTVTGRAAQDSVSRAMVLAFGLDHIIVSSDRPKDPAAARYLENTASTRGKPSITAEAGYAGTVTPADVDALINGSLNVMGYLRMIERTSKPMAHALWFERVVTVSSDSAGIFYPLVDRDTWVTAGQKLGYVTDYLGRRLQDLATPEAGLVLYINAVPTMLKGGTVANIGVQKKTP